MHPCVPGLAVRGNERADTLVKEAAREHPLEDLTATKCTEELELAETILERIVAIAGAFLAATPKVPRTIKVPNYKPTMTERIRALLSPCNGEPATGLQKMALRKFASDLPMPGRNFSHIRDQAPRRRRQLPHILVVTGLDSDSE